MVAAVVVTCDAFEFLHLAVLRLADRHHCESLGLLQDRPLTVAYPVPPAGFVLAVSIEPEGGSPTGAPQGPIVAAGKLAKI